MSADTPVITAHPTRAPAARSGLTHWRYTRDRRHGTLLTARHDSSTPTRRTLADAVITAPQPCRADGRSTLAGVFDRLPGLTIAAVPIGAAALLLGDHTGDITLIPGGAAELAAVGAFLWLITGRRLHALAAISRIEPAQGRGRTIEGGAADLTQELNGLGEVTPGRATLVIAVGDLGQRQQHLRLVDRRP
jgi:hypothetical protein